MRSQRKGGLSATTQVKELSPEIIHIAQGQGLWSLEARGVDIIHPYVFLLKECLENIFFTVKIVSLKNLYNRWSSLS